MSNRLSFVLLTLLIFVIIGALAYSQGLTPVIVGDTPDEKVTSLFIPLLGVLGTVLSFLRVLDARVAEGKIEAGSVVDMVSLAEFYPATISVLIGAASMFGAQIISPDTQALVVSVFTMLTSILLYSFANRAPGDPVPVAQKVQQLN